METVTVGSLAELETLAHSVLARSRATAGHHARVISLTGDLGAGKTAFVQAVARQLGVTESVTSPTFTILKQYATSDPTWPTLLHMDAYRIESLEELRPLNFKNLLEQPQTLFCIEWGEKIAAALPPHHLSLMFTITNDTTREVQVF